MSFARLAIPSVILAAISGCSEPVPPTAKGAWTVNFSDTGANCSISGHGAKVGDVTGTERTAVVTDGESGAEVTCTVQGSGSFSVDGRAILGANSLQIIIPSISAAAKKEAPVTGRAGYSSGETAGNQYVSAKEDDSTPELEACSFYFAAGSAESVAEGKIWVTFECPSMLADTESCAIKQSYAIFEDCVTGNEEE